MLFVHYQIVVAVLNRFQCIFFRKLYACEFPIIKQEVTEMLWRLLSCKYISLHIFVSKNCRLIILQFSYIFLCPIYVGTYCTMLRLLDHFWPPDIPCYSTEDAGQIVNWVYFNPNHVTTITIIYYAVTHWHGLQSYTFVTTITHSYSLRCVTFTQLTILHANIPFSHSLHNTLQIKLSHFETLAENWLREFTS
jgi:hypothetical protein